MVSYPPCSPFFGANAHKHSYTQIFCEPSVILRFPSFFLRFCKGSRTVAIFLSMIKISHFSIIFPWSRSFPALLARFVMYTLWGVSHPKAKEIKRKNCPMDGWFFFSLELFVPVYVPAHGEHFPSPEKYWRVLYKTLSNPSSTHPGAHASIPIPHSLSSASFDPNHRTRQTER